VRLLRLIWSDADCFELTLLLLAATACFITILALLSANAPGPAAMILLAESLIVARAISMAPRIFRGGRQ